MNEYLDHVVKAFFLMIISAISEVQCRVDKLWQRGRSNGRRDHESFGRHISQNCLKKSCWLPLIALVKKVAC